MVKKSPYHHHFHACSETLNSQHSIQWHVLITTSLGSSPSFANGGVEEISELSTYAKSVPLCLTEPLQFLALQ